MGDLIKVNFKKGRDVLTNYWIERGYKSCNKHIPTIMYHYNDKCHKCEENRQLVVFWSVIIGFLAFADLIFSNLN